MQKAGQHHRVNIGESGTNGRRDKAIDEVAQAASNKHMWAHHLHEPKSFKQLCKTDPKSLSDKNIRRIRRKENATSVSTKRGHKDVDRRRGNVPPLNSNDDNQAQGADTHSASKRVNTGDTSDVANSTCHAEALAHAASTVQGDVNARQNRSPFDMEPAWAAYQRHLEGKTADNSETAEKADIIRQAANILRGADEVAQINWQEKFTQHAMGVQTHRSVLFHIEQIYASLEASKAEMVNASREVLLTYSDTSALQALITAADNTRPRGDSQRHEQALHALIDTILDNRPGSHKPDGEEQTHQILTPVAQIGEGQQDKGPGRPVVCTTQRSGTLSLPVCAGAETKCSYWDSQESDDENDETRDTEDDEIPFEPVDTANTCDTPPEEPCAIHIAGLWNKAHFLMTNGAAPALVSAVDTKALEMAASLWGFSSPNSVESMILKQQQCIPLLPCMVLLRAKFGELAYPGIAKAMWRYDVQGNSIMGIICDFRQIQGRYTSLQEAYLAWEVHYHELHAYSTVELRPSIDGIIRTFAVGMNYSHSQTEPWPSPANHATDMWQLLQCYCKVYFERLGQIILLWKAGWQLWKVRCKCSLSEDMKWWRGRPCGSRCGPASWHVVWRILTKHAR